jgi:hypothetical protein
MNHYFQFPLCALSFAQESKNGVDCIISFACVEVGKERWQKFSENERGARILQDEIWKRAHGFKSDRVFRAEMNRRRRPFLTPRQVRSIIERLHGRHFFARVTFGRRQTYYSNRLSNKELADRIFTAKIQRSLARQERIRADADLTKRIQAARRKLAGSDATDGATDAPL